MLEPYGAEWVLGDVDVDVGVVWYGVGVGGCCYWCGRREVCGWP